ncbi:MAG: hypothetical protein K2L87_06075 [Clostridiales bacterium]|nr:hypothetical protein [Clostridiales bacterium]
MEKQYVKKAEKVEAENAAKKEEPFPASQLLQEIAPLLEDYFVGEVRCDEEGIALSFLNGQKFLLKAEAV